MTGAKSQHRPWPARALGALCILLIRLYQVTLSPLFRGQCRFHPSCSVYAIEAYREHGPYRGTVLTARRLLRCHPFTRGGYDPVPLAGHDRTRPDVAADHPRDS